MNMNIKNTLLLAVLSVVATACLSTKAREHTLVPAIRAAWVGVHADVDAGIADAVQHGENVTTVSSAVVELDDAVHDGDQLRIAATQWETIAPYGERGVSAQVESGALSPLVAPSLLERLHRFGEAIAKMRIIP